MSDEKALLAAIWEHPHEDTPRLVYADWLDEAVLAAEGAGAAAVGAIPRLARLEYARAAAPGATVDADVWQADGGWSCRLSDSDGDLLRARLEPLGIKSTGEPRA